MLRLGLLTAISLLLAPAAFSQTVARKPLPTEPLEKYDNPPAVAAAGTSDFAGVSLTFRSVHKLSS